MTDVSAPSGRVLLAAEDGAIASWLASCFADSEVSFDVCASPSALASLDPATLDVLLVEPAILPAEGDAHALDSLREAGVPVLAVVPAAEWSAACARIAASGLQPLDLLSPGDPANVVRARVGLGLRLAHAERTGESLRAELIELERNRVVVQLAGAVAHKLKQPLTVALGYMELLLEDPETDVQLDPLTLHYLREIREAVHTMDDVVNRLQRATVHQTRKYAGALEILDLDRPGPGRGASTDDG